MFRITGLVYYDYVFNKDPVFNNDFIDPFGPVKIIAENIEPHSTVLDIGCNSGILGKILQKKQCLVDGVDINKNALQKAKPYYRNLYQRNLYTEDLKLNKAKYDVVVCADILEHLPRPDQLIREVHKYINKNGIFWVSLPNIARLELRLQHLLGNFDYKPGIMSPDHLRHFTQKTSQNLLKNNGYKILCTYYTGLGQRIKVLPNLFSFQFVYKCLLD